MSQHPLVFKRGVLLQCLLVCMQERISLTASFCYPERSCNMASLLSQERSGAAASPSWHSSILQRAAVPHQEPQNYQTRCSFARNRWMFTISGSYLPYNIRINASHQQMYNSLWIEVTTYVGINICMREKQPLLVEIRMRENIQGPKITKVWRKSTAPTSV